MNNLLEKLSSSSGKKTIEPREIFMSLPKRGTGYEYPRDVQSEVWKKWFGVREKKNTIIKMNTGSGKTIVGLLILQSCLNEGKGPAIYVVPDNYLVNQVCLEANKLGIKVTTERDDYAYSSKKGILVMPIHALVNGRSVFGMRQERNYPISSILIDDVHACLESITTQFSLKIPSRHSAYTDIMRLFEHDIQQYNSNGFTEVFTAKDPLKRLHVPFWIWQDHANEVYANLLNYCNDDDVNKDIFFSLPLLGDCWESCHCTITASALEIMPFGVDIKKIRSFENAERRIFMSATLSDDSVFVSTMGLEENDVENIITPEKANDIGDRLILFPKHLNNHFTDENIRDKVLSYADKCNVVVIVPSFERAKFWDSTGEYIVKKENINDVVANLRTNANRLAVFVNRYDGIDLPGDACRMLVIDGLPPLNSEYDKYVQSIDPTSSVLLQEQVQRIEQGIGRGVRSNNDSCCIVLMGDSLSDVLVRNNGLSYFSSSTNAQYSLSQNLWDLLKEENSMPSLDDIFNLADFSLQCNPDWVKMCKECLSDVEYTGRATINYIDVALRKAFDYLRTHEYQNAMNAIDSAISNKKTPDSTKGYLLQIKAEVCNLVNKTRAQEIQMTARRTNISTLLPIDGIQYAKNVEKSIQANKVIERIKEIAQDPNSFSIYINRLLPRLAFSPNADDFEEALCAIGKLLGFISTRPDKETGGEGSDNLWNLQQGTFWVIECKSGATNEKISKDYCNQLGGSIRWAQQKYGNEFSYIPIMVHKSTVCDEAATPVDNMRVIDEWCLTKFVRQLSDFTLAVTQTPNWNNLSNVEVLLRDYKLRTSDLQNEYTKPCIK